MFPIERVNLDWSEDLEQLGTKPKDWFRRAGGTRITDDANRSRLYPGTSARKPSAPVAIPTMMTANDPTALFVAWHAETPTRRWGPVGRLERVVQPSGAELYRYFYTRGARTLEGFRPFDGMPDLEQVYESNALFPLFVNRLLPPGRPEYRQFLKWSGFDPDDLPEPLVVLGRSEGIKKTDVVEVFPCPRPDRHGCYLNFFFVHGVRYHLATAHDALENLHPGDRLTLKLDPDNPVDPNAVAIEADGTRLGYAPRYLARDFARLMRDCPSETVDLFVHTVNPNAPLQQRLLCRMRACWPDGFRPCDGDEFQPIAAGVSVLD